MIVLGLILITIGYIVSLVGSIQLLIRMFHESYYWGFAAVFLNVLVALLFIIVHWQESRKPFLIVFIGLLLTAGGFLIYPPALSFIEEMGKIFFGVGLFVGIIKLIEITSK